MPALVEEEESALQSEESTAPRALRKWPTRRARNFNPNHDELGRFAGADAGGRVLTGLEKTALRQYTSFGYSTLNRHLRQGGPATGAVTTLDGAFAAAVPLVREATVYRGMGGPAASAPAVGKTYTDLGFISTSLNENKALGFTGSVGLVVITLPVGATVLNLEARQVGAGEAEILLPRGSSFRVTGRSGGGGTGRLPTIRMTLIV